MRRYVLALDGYLRGIDGCFQMREVSSLADVSMASWTPTTDPMRLPEIRHNLRLITESCRTDLDGLAREARALAERKKWIHAEDARLRKQVDEEAERELIYAAPTMYRWSDS